MIKKIRGEENWMDGMGDIKVCLGRITLVKDDFPFELVCFHFFFFFWRGVNRGRRETKRILKRRDGMD